jgi:DNA ligase (NAD+)
MEEIIKQLNEWTKLYDEGHPAVSDKEWDELYFKLVAMEKEAGFSLPESPTRKINYEIVSSLKKVQHNHLMLSLAKTKNWADFVNYFSNIGSGKDIVLMPKLDGLTCSLRYINGELVSAETRGNGQEGEDILHNAKVIDSIPNKIDYKDELIIDGEVICTYKNFENWNEEFRNPRNFAAGSIRSLDSKVCAKRNLSFICWNVIIGFEENSSFIYKLGKLNKLGFITVPWVSTFDLDAKEYIIEKSKELSYPIDGLVARFDDLAFGRDLGETAHHPKSAYAFKFYDEEYETILRGIDWSLGRTGVLTPIACFDPIDIDGTVITKASLHNLSILNELSGGYQNVGDKLYIYKANQIIPQASRWEHQSDGIELSVPLVCPVCGGATKIQVSDSGTNVLVCTNPACQGKFLNKLDHFCGTKGLDIKGLSLATLEKIYNWGWVNTLADLYNLKNYRDIWINKPGFGIASVDKILNAIENSKDTTLESFISAIGIPTIGKTISKEIIKYVPTYENFRELILEKFDWSTYDGFGIITSDFINNFDYTEADNVFPYLSFKKIEHNQTNQLNGKTFCITGTLKTFKNRAELQNKIESAGGKVVSAVSAKVDYLINNNIDSTSSKNLAARKLNIPIISEEEVKKFLTF